MSKNELKKRSGDSGNETLFNDVDVIARALFDNKTLPKNLISTANNRPKSIVKPQLPETKSKSKVNEDRFLKDKKSIWNWKALKAFTNVRSKRFNCCFSLQVHSIEGLPPSFKGHRLCVKWKRRDGELTTRPAAVSQGVAQFEEQLTHTCSVCGSSSSGPHNSAKYEAKHFLLYAFVFDEPEFDFGKHKVDLTRLLPITLEELEEEKSSGMWTTSYKLSDKAKGAKMNVSFGYSVISNSSSDPCGQTDGQSMIKRGESLPVISHAFSSSVEDIKDLHEVLPISRSELSDSMDELYKKLDDEKSIISVDYEPQRGVQTVPLKPESPPGSEFSVMDKGIELPMKKQSKPEQEEKGVNLEYLLVKFESQREEPVIVESHTQEQDSFDKETLIKKMESALNNVTNVVKEDYDSQEESEISKEEKVKDNYTEFKSGYKGTRKVKLLNLDHDTETVASDFLNMLGIEHSPFRLSSESEPESPRERLLRQFEKDTLTAGSSLFNFNLDDDETGFGPEASSVSIWGPIRKEHESSSMLHTSEEMLKSEIQRMQNKTKASILEDMETEALIHEWGLNERAFQRSPSNTSGGLGSPIDLPPEEPLELPPLGEGLGPIVQTRNGGFLQSMDPEIFRNAKTGGSLIMQVSNPVVVPAEMGSGVMDILQCLASVGIEKLSMQANKVMPLEDISGKTMQQIAWEAAPTVEAPERLASLQQEPVVGQIAPGEPTRLHGSKKYESHSIARGTDPEYVSLDDLAPLAMNKIEALSIEGLRIQSGLSDKDAPSNISPQSIGKISVLEGKKVDSSGSIGLEGTGGLQLLDIKQTNDDDVDGIMGLSVTLDEWMRLDSGEIDDGDEISERTSRILAAHHASDLMRARSRDRRGKGSRKGGHLGNNFTVALMVQLRDPLRNFEPVGTPMLALVQVERVFIPPKPKIHSMVCTLWKNNKDEDEVDVEPVKHEGKREAEERVTEEESVLVPQFKITEVHVAGLKTEPSKKTFWGSNTKQQQVGSRWLLANGMGKKNPKHPLMKSKIATGKSTSDSFWSISSKAKGSVKVDAPVRNPNVIIPNETVKLLSGAGFV